MLNFNILEMIKTIFDIIFKKGFKDINGDEKDEEEEEEKDDEKTNKENEKWKKLKPINLSKINFINYPQEQYFSSPNDIYPKKQIVLHHTLSGPGTRGDIEYWLSTTKRIGTCVIIERNGNVDQLFNSRYWAWHIGAGNSMLEKHSIGIELDSWGQLRKYNNKFMTIYGNTVDVPVQYYPEKFRDEEYFEAYTIEQLKSLGELLLFWNKRYDIPLDYNEDMWDVSDRALNGTPGIWTHVSYRPYPQVRPKWDCHPDPNLISLLKTLSTL